MKPSKNIGIALYAVLSLSACDRSADPSTKERPAPTASVAVASPATQALIAVDAAHDVMIKKGAPPYVIAPSAELVLDTGEYRFSGRDAGTVTPDAVHVAHGSSGYYRTRFAGKRTTLGASSLDSLKGRDGFPGFEAGESYIVAIGTEAPSATDGAMGFTPAWTAMVTVSAR